MIFDFFYELVVVIVYPELCARVVCFKVVCVVNERSVSDEVNKPGVFEHDQIRVDEVDFFAYCCEVVFAQ